MTHTFMCNTQMRSGVVNNKQLKFCERYSEFCVIEHNDVHGI
jgi:hypothetical protein